MKVLFADDHALFLDSLIGYIRNEYPDAQLDCAKDVDDALSYLDQTNDYDLVMVDYRMPGMSGLKGLDRIKEKHPKIPVALMTGVADREQVREAMKRGAIAYFPKTLTGSQMLNGIQIVMSGRRFAPLDKENNLLMKSFLNGDGKSKNPFENVESLTPREIEVLGYLMHGLSNKEIARYLDLQVVTIKLHVRSICSKLQVKNRTQIAVKAREMGLEPAELSE